MIMRKSRNRRSWWIEKELAEQIDPLQEQIDELKEELSEL